MSAGAQCFEAVLVPHSSVRGRHALLSHIGSWRGLLVALVVMMSACGGGTTGTSSTDSLKFSGYAETANGQRASDLSMSVQSAATDQTLVDSGTDRRGDFSMALPSDESGFLVIVDGVGEATIVRNQSGAGTMTSKLAATSNGALMVKDLFETQIDPISLCSGLTADGDGVVVSGDVPSGSCPVTFRISSEQLPSNSFRGYVVGTCDGVRKTILTGLSSREGELTLDLAAAFTQGCVDIQMLISSTNASDLTATFFVE